MNTIAVYPGTFDPMTVGHVDVVERTSRMFDEVIVAVAASTHKGPFFSLDERVSMATRITDELENVRVVAFNGLLVDLAREFDSRIIIRGLRAISDFEYEVQIAGVNRHLAADIETIFIAAAQDYTFLSSSIVREIARMKGDVSDFVHPLVIEEFTRKHDRALHADHE